MSKQLPTLLLLPSPAIAGGLDVASQNVFETLFGFMTNFSYVLAVLCIIFVCIKLIFDDDPGAAFKYMPMPIVFFGIPMFLNSVRDKNGKENETVVVVADKPGIFEKAFDWIGGHWLWLVFGVLAIVIGSYSVYKFIDRKKTAKKALSHVRELLNTLDVVDNYLEYWTEFAPTYDTKEKTKSDRISTLNRIQNDILYMLESVHGGVPMNEDLLKKLNEIKININKVSLDSNGAKIILVKSATSTAS